MGLDMYLDKHIFVGAEYEHRNVKGTVDITVGGEPLPINFNKISYIVERGTYWRKANAIHRWFVENCQDGIDECQTAYVSREQLEELLDLCKRVREKKEHVLEKGLVPELALPTESGFFFGSTDYDEWYWEDIDYTIEELSRIISEDTGLEEYYYHSSW